MDGFHFFLATVSAALLVAWLRAQDMLCLEQLTSGGLRMKIEGLEADKQTMRLAEIFLRASVDDWRGRAIRAESAIESTVAEMADGEDCTLRRLKDVLSSR